MVATNIKSAIKKKAIDFWRYCYDDNQIFIDKPCDFVSLF